MSADAWGEFEKWNASRAAGKNIDPNASPYDVNAGLFRRSMTDSGTRTARYNRPDTFGAFGQQQTTNADGSVSQGFTGGFGTLNDNLTQQAANAAANPMDWGQFGTLGTGAAAGRQASQAAFGQSRSRLDPMWQKGEKKLRTSMFQTGMADSDPAQDTMNEFGRAKNDAYSGAMTNALQQGMRAQQSAFGGNLASRQQGVSNALRGQMQPFEELNGMQGFLTQPEYNRDNSMMVADASVNQTAPIQAFAAHERAVTDKMMPDFFTDRPGDAPGSGAQRRKRYESMTGEQQGYIREMGPNDGNRILSGSRL